MDLSIRVALKTVGLDSVLAVFDLSQGSYMYAAEGMATDNPHVHMYLSTGTALPTIRARLRKLGLSGNGGYSITTVRDKLKCLAYFMKGGDYSTNLPDDVIQQAKMYDAKVKTEMAEKKAKPKSLVHELSKTFNEAYSYPTLTGRGPGLQTAQFELAKFLIQYHREHDLPIRKHQLTMLYDTIMFWHSDLSQFAEDSMVICMTGAAPPR